jgi:hypothetical protein
MFARFVASKGDPVSTWWISFGLTLMSELIFLFPNGE